MRDFAFRARTSSPGQAVRLLMCCAAAMSLLWLALSVQAQPWIKAQPWRQVLPNTEPADNLSDSWKINGNGSPGEIVISQAYPSGRIEGTMYGDRIVGYFAWIERTMVLVRYSAASSNPSQAFVGTVSDDGQTWSGRFYGLDMSWSGATEAQNAFAFTATRMTATFPPAPPAVMPGVMYGRPELSSQFAIHNRPKEYATGWAGTLSIQSGANSNPNQGQLDGTVFGDPFIGTYASHTGTIAFLRLQKGQPAKVFVGKVDSTRLAVYDMSGLFYPLTEGMGADPSRLTFDWRAFVPGCDNACQ
jgi:hypothetical protein